MAFQSQVEIIQEQRLTTHVFWKLYTSFEFRRSMMLEALSFGSVTLEESRKDDDARYLRMSAVPSFSLPHAVEQIVGPRFGYVEEGTFDVKKRRYTYRIIPSTLSDRVNLEGSIDAVDIDGGKCVCTVRIEQSSEMTGLGGLLERLMARSTAKNMKDAWARLAPYFDEHGPEWFSRLPETERNVLP